MMPKLLPFAVALVCVFSGGIAAQEAPDASPAKLRPDDIFKFTHIWTIHLTFTPEQWQAMEPKDAGRPQRGGRRRGSFLQGPEGGRNGIAAAFGLVYDYVRADLEFGP